MLLGLGEARILGLGGDDEGLAHSLGIARKAAEDLSWWWYLVTLSARQLRFADVRPPFKSEAPNRRRVRQRLRASPPPAVPCHERCDSSR